MYDYREAMTEDVKEWIKENIDLTEWTEDREGLEQQLNDDLWTEDSITGNVSGSYYCNSYEAEESIAHNWDLLNEALDEFGQNDINVIKKGAEWADVTIRCYLLWSVISEVLDELEENGDFDESDN